MNAPVNFRKFVDSFQSLLTGLGVYGRDKTLSMRPELRGYENLTWDKYGLDSLYRSNWLARKIVDIPAFDATRAWRKWDATQDQVEALEMTEKQFGMQRKLLSGLIKARLYGGAAMIMGINGQAMNEELDLDKVGKGDLKFVHVVEKWMIATGPRVRDIMSPWFGEPSYYMRSNIPIIESPGGVTPLPSFTPKGEAGSAIWIHPSRVVRLIGIEYPDIEMAQDAWGDSVLQPMYEALREAGLVSSSLANMIGDCKVDVYKIPGLTNTLSTADGTSQLMTYLTNANAAKSVLNSLIMDKEFEWERIQTGSFEGLTQVLQAFYLMCCAAADIPSTRMLSREPAGQNSTGDSDFRNYYDRLHADQEVRLTPVMTRLDEVIIRTTFGKRDPSIKYEWNSLWQMSDAEKADIALKKAQAFQVDNNAALIPPEVLAVGRENQLVQDGTYPGLDDALNEYEAQLNIGEGEGDYGPEASPQPGQPPSIAQRLKSKQIKQGEEDPDDDQPESESPKEQATTDADEPGHEFHGNQYTSGAGSAERRAEIDKFIRGIRNPGKKDYAQRYSAWLHGGQKGLEPERGKLSGMAAQSVRLNLHALHTTQDEESGHEFHGNQYTGGEGGGEHGPEPKHADVDAVKNSRMAAKYHMYARAARLLAKERDHEQQARFNLELDKKYKERAAYAQRLTRMPAVQRVLVQSVTSFVSKHSAIIQSFAINHVAFFANKHTVGVAHQAAFRHLLMPLVEAGLLAGMVELGAGALVTGVGMEVAHYSVHHLIEHSPLSEDNAAELLAETAKRLHERLKSRRARHVLQHAATHHSDSVLDDAVNYDELVDALQRYAQALDQYRALRHDEWSEENES